MIRKVSKIGPSTLMISLPSKWVKKYDINKGSELNITEKGKILTISTENLITTDHKTTVDFSNLEPRVIKWYLSALHKTGLDEIKILYNNQKTIELIKGTINNLLIGFTIIEQNNKYIIIKQISVDLEQEFRPILRRSFLVTLTLAKQSLELIKNKQYEKLKNTKLLELTNNKLTNFCQRILIKNQYIIPTKTCFAYVIIWNLEKIADDYKYICDELFKRKAPLSKEIIDLYQQVNELLESYYNLFYKFKIQDLNELSAKRTEILNKIKNSKTENNLIINYLQSLTLKIVDFSSSIIALNHL